MVVKKWICHHNVPQIILWWYWKMTMKFSSKWYSNITKGPCATSLTRVQVLDWMCMLFAFLFVKLGIQIWTSNRWKILSYSFFIKLSTSYEGPLTWNQLNLWWLFNRLRRYIFININSLLINKYLFSLRCLIMQSSPLSQQRTSFYKY